MLINPLSVGETFSLNYVSIVFALQNMSQKGNTHNDFKYSLLFGQNSYFSVHI